MSLSAVLDRLSKEHATRPSNGRFFGEGTLSNWSSKTRDYVTEFHAIESTQEKEKWVRELFIELFDILQEPELPGGLTMAQISTFIDVISNGTGTNISNHELGSIVGKMFIAVSTQYANVDDTKIASLAKINGLLSREIYKFSRASSKLMTGEQTTLLRHLLKRSKYELKKFNLLAECPTGYSQLVMLLSNAYNDPDNQQKVSYYNKQVGHIIGKYSLDSMRCLDIILDVSSEYISNHYDFLLELLKESAFWPRNNEANPTCLKGLNEGGNLIASNVISFRISQSGSDIDSNYLDMVCILIKSGFVNALSIWRNIGPDNNSLNDYFNEYEADLEKESMKGVENPLAMAAALAFEEDDRDTRKRSDSDGGNTANGEISPKDEKNPEEPQSDKSESLLQSGKTKLLQRLLINGCITAGFYLLKLHPTFVNIDDSIPLALIRAFEHTIDSIYRSLVFVPPSTLQSSKMVTIRDTGILSHKPRLLEERKTHNPSMPFELTTRAVFYYPEWDSELSPVTTIEELVERSHEFFSIPNVRLELKPQLISKLCRIGKADISNGNGSVDRWVDYVRKFIFPSVASLDVNPMAANDIFELMKFFPFEKRYFIYNEMMTKLSRDILPIKVGFNRTEREAKGMLKALSIDSLDEHSRRLANLISTNPLATLVPAVKQIENYDKVSELLVHTASLLNDFAYDVLQFVLLLRLTEDRNAVQEDGVNQSMWVQRLSIFIAGLAKSCEKMDLANIMAFIVKTLHNGNIVAVSILKQLVVTVGGIRDLNEVNTKQLLMLNSGEPLKTAARKLIFDFRDENHTLGSRLVEYFAKEKTISEVIVLLYNLNLKANTYDAHYKILSLRCDEMNTLLWSFIELIKHSLDAEKYVENVLPLDLLTNVHKISTPWVFHIWREYIANHEEDENVRHMVENAQFEEVDFSCVSRDLFITFWKLSLYDIQFSRDLYDERKDALETELGNCSSTKKKNELSNQIKDLLVCCISHQKRFNQSKKYLQEKSQLWTHDNKKDSIRFFFQYCAIPRLLFSPSDAIYVSSFLLLAYDIGSLMRIIAYFIRSEVLNSLLFCCTGSEAGNLGIFFAQLLEQLENMRKNDQLDQPSRRELYEWHKVITEQVVVTLSNKNYMSIRNGIEFMRNLSHVFPVIDSQINLVCQAVLQNLQGEEREDIKLPSNALLGHLRARLKSAISLEDFCELNDEELKEKTQHQAELEEIKAFELQQANEKKEIELRKQLELNKKQRENAEKTKESTKETIEEAARSPVEPSTQKVTWPFGKVLRFMDDVSGNFRRNNLTRALSCITDQQERDNVRSLTKQAMPLKDFKSSVLAVFEGFFVSLVNNPKNPEFLRKLDDLRASVENVTRDAAKKRSDMYSEISVRQEPQRYSRYNGSTKAEPQRSSSTVKATKTAEDPNQQRSYSSKPSTDRSLSSRITAKTDTAAEGASFTREKAKTDKELHPVYSNRQKRSSQATHDQRPRGPKAEEGRRTPTPLAPRALLGSDRSAQRFQSRTSGERRPYESAQSSEERPFKRFRAGEKPADSRQSSRAPERSRYNDRKSQPLPQGPRGAKESQSRYQR